MRFRTFAHATFLICLTATAEDKVCTLPDGTGQYVLSLPANYDAKKEYELIVALHGSGDPPEHFVKALRSMMPGRECIVAVPFSKDVAAWSSDEIAVVEGSVDAVRKTCRIKRDRVMLFGFSAGCSIGFWFLALRPALFNAFAAFGSEVDSGLADEDLKAAHGVPVYYCVGKKDPHHSATAQACADHLKALGFTLQYDASEGVGHTITPEQLKRMFTWFDAEFKKNAAKDESDDIKIGPATRDAHK
jgi:predicted esterase